jgi:putative DNA primase/helicase
VFASGRAKIIPFERHFSEDEQDKGLKQFFRRAENKSGILNWQVWGYRLILEVGFEPPQRVVEAIAAYRQEADVIGQFLADCTSAQEGNRVTASDLYAAYTPWAKDNGYKALNHKNFVSELRRRLDVRRGGAGNIVVGLALDYAHNSYTA